MFFLIFFILNARILKRYVMRVRLLTVYDYVGLLLTIFGFQLHLFQAHRQVDCVFLSLLFPGGIDAALQAYKVRLSLPTRPFSQLTCFGSYVPPVNKVPISVENKREPKPGIFSEHFGCISHHRYCLWLPE
jgi:hypothetical protein